MVQWIYQFGQRRHQFALPTLYVLVNLVLAAIGIFVSTEDIVRSELPFPHYLGTTLLFILLPAYLMLAISFLWNHTERAISTLSTLTQPEATEHARKAMSATPALRYAVLVIGFIFGLSQNMLFVGTMLTTQTATLIDLVFVIQSAVLWMLIADTILWRVGMSLSVSLFARTLRIDVLSTRLFQPISKMATTDILVIAGAMSFMPLQSLDAEFRIWNYQTGFIIGTLAAISLFLLPLLGVRHNIRRAKNSKLAALYEKTSHLPPANIVELEAHYALIDRIASVSNWAIDLKLIARIFGYVIIPPIAWLGAALVEKFVGQL